LEREVGMLMTRVKKDEEISEVGILKVELLVPGEQVEAVVTNLWVGKWR
jgi:hypothetical protein